MTAPIKNNYVPQNDPYEDVDGDGYPDYPYGDEGLGEDPSGNRYQGEPKEDASTVTVEYARQYLNDLKDLLKISELSAAAKMEIKKEIEALKGKVNLVVGMSPTAQERALTSINEKIFELESRINGEEKTETGTGSLQGQIEETRQKAKEYLDKGVITQGTYEKIIQDLDKGQTFLDVDGESEMGQTKAQEMISSALDRLVNGGSSSEKAQKLADKLNVDPEAVQQAAEDAGVDLKAEPIVVNDKLMKMFQALGVPSSQDLTTLVALQDQYKKEVEEWSGKGDTATQEWRKDSEHVPDIRIWTQLHKYYSKTDPISQQMGQLKDKIGNQLIETLATLDIVAGPGTQKGRIMVNGTEMDFVNEDMGTYKLDSVFNELTDPYFSPAPRNREAGGFYSNEPGDFWNTVGHGQAEVNEDWQATEGFPTVSFSEG